eukprot:1486305-Prymnesium_polylepis.1
MGDGVRGLMGKWRSRVDFGDCGVGSGGSLRVRMARVWGVGTPRLIREGVGKSTLVPQKVHGPKGPTLYCVFAIGGCRFAQLSYPIRRFLKPLSSDLL